MKKRILSILLVLCVMVGCMPLVLQEASAETGKKITDYSTGDTLEFGWYPQSKVTDGDTVSKLEAVTKSWISYGYYSGTSVDYDGEMKPSDYMKYCDITLEGNKYRAVTFSKYRKRYTDYTADTSTSFTLQGDNGYYINNVYYFKYEPLKWVVLDASTGLVVCDSAIDSQAYNNYVLKLDDVYYGDSNKKNYASDWEHSSLKAWLNDDFLNTAFSSSQQSEIKEITRENKAFWDSTYDSNPTSDKTRFCPIGMY